MTEVSGGTQFAPDAGCSSSRTRPPAPPSGGPEAGAGTEVRSGKKSGAERTGLRAPPPLVGPTSAAGFIKRGRTPVRTLWPRTVYQNDCGCLRPGIRGDHGAAVPDG